MATNFPHTDPIYRCPPGGSLRLAILLLALTLTLAVILPAHDLRLLALVFAIPAIFWISRGLLRRRAFLHLKAEALTLRHPTSLGTQHLPYHHIGGVLAWPNPDTLGIVYYLPRQPFEGEEDPRPPRLCTTITAPLAGINKLLPDLESRVRTAHDSAANTSMPLLPEADVRRRLRGRRFRRRMLAVIIFLATPLLTILASRVLFTLINAIRYVRP